MPHLVFTKTKGVYPAIIRAITRSDYNHVYIEVTEEIKYEADMKKGVVRFTELTEKEKARISGFRRYYIPVMPGRESDLMDANWWLAGTLGAKYDWWGVAGILFNRPWTKGGRWYCSRLAAQWLAFFYPPAFIELAGQDISPADLQFWCHKHFRPV